MNAPDDAKMKQRLLERRISGGDTPGSLPIQHSVGFASPIMQIIKPKPDDHDKMIEADLLDSNDSKGGASSRQTSILKYYQKDGSDSETSRDFGSVKRPRYEQDSAGQDRRVIDISDNDSTEAVAVDGRSVRFVVSSRAMDEDTTLGNGKDNGSNLHSMMSPGGLLKSSSSSSSSDFKAPSTRGRKKGSKNKPTPPKPPITSPTKISDSIPGRKYNDVEVRCITLQQRLDASEASEQELRVMLAKEQDSYSRQTDALVSLLRSQAVQGFRDRKRRLAEESVRLGRITLMKSGAGNVIESLEDGYAFQDVRRQAREIAGRKELLEARKKILANAKRARTRLGKNNEGALEEDDIDMTAEDFMLRHHLDQIKKEEDLNASETQMLIYERQAHLRNSRRVEHQEQSKLADLPLLNNRYLLQFVIGKGGFSEVWEAYDLKELRCVAVKIHSLQRHWTGERKEAYTKHVTRELDIQSVLNHPRIARLFEAFEIDNESFATVLELCNGTDLEERLKTGGLMSEKDARPILLQIMSGVRYLNNPRTDKIKTIIHYDLKPANVLFDEFGDVKITDFGLSKMLTDEGPSLGSSMELTSIGAGTYYYLPPECFPSSMSSSPPRISSKVDVWSIGVIYFEMLYNMKPFGEGMTQQAVMSSYVTQNARNVVFPTTETPKVSDEAKDFIRACLVCDQTYRPDVPDLCGHQYLRQRK